MNAGRKFDINLAARPLRNRRFFVAAVSALAALALLFAWLGFGSFVRAKAEQRRALAEYDRLERQISVEERARSVREAETKALMARSKDRLERVNTVILKKAFSWVDFFTMLESALPPSSYISSMSPVTPAEGGFEVKFKVVSRSMGDLTRLIQNLLAVTGRPPLVLSETRSGGQFVSEITLTYEKPR